eukprot:COSAG02_NODE_44988_length_361_cov_0.782443_1_plen_78_part_10
MVHFTLGTSWRRFPLFGLVAAWSVGEHATQADDTAQHTPNMLGVNPSFELDDTSFTPRTSRNDPTCRDLDDVQEQVRH